MISQRAQNIVASVTGELSAKVTELKAQGKDVIKLNIGEPDFRPPENIAEAAIAAIEEGFSKYVAIPGIIELRKAICAKLEKDNHLVYSPNEICVSTGAKQAVMNALMALCDPGDEVIIPTPCWVSYSEMVKLTGAAPVFVPCKAETGFALNVDDIAAAVTPHTKAIIICTPNNPTGALMSKELLESIVEIARGVGAYILCDEVYRHLTQEDEWCESIVDLYEKGISVSSMSKVFSLAGLRMGWIATHDEAARKAFLSHRDYNLISCGMFDDVIASIALRHSDVMLKRNQRIVRENLAILDDWIKENPHFFYTKPKAGTTALVYYDFDIPSYEFCKRMYHETGAFVTPGDCFEQPHSMRVGYACDVNTLRDGLAAVTKFAATL